MDTSPGLGKPNSRTTPVTWVLGLPLRSSPGVKAAKNPVAPYRLTDVLEHELSPTDLWTCVENCYSSNSSEEDEGAAEGIPLAQPLMDMPEPEPEAQPFMRHPDEHGGLSLSSTLEEEGDHCLGELPADKLNRKDVTQLDDAFLEDPEALDNIASSSKDEPGPPCFC
ncbi:uncharacterized protein LOC127035293 isoform X3 [Gopherus flavomarginatus]|uniref:uncharacterized protein LOC127035293 isoform X3 n=1 Tax=Gopherus flavomarginatus TaxID=286002 RepID=UPI0021CBC818|nr:uncharacterized protein LOC127035293 isoform X3 [Gopherus flavomarginatus]